MTAKIGAGKLKQTQVTQQKPISNKVAMFTGEDGDISIISLMMQSSFFFPSLP